jgi:hypothetical protein
MVATEKVDPSREKFLHNWMNTRLAHEGMMLEKILRQTRIVEQLAAQTRDGKFTGGEVSSVPEGEDMGVSIGNETHNHHYAPETKPSGSSIGLLGKLAVAAALVSGGAGVGVLVNQLLAPDPPPVVDTNSATDVTFPD